jgi:hypothetical protein
MESRHSEKGAFIIQHFGNLVYILFRESIKFKMRNRLLITALIVFWFGCTNKKPDQDNLNTIVLKKNEDVEVLSRFVSGLEYIELNYPADSLIGPIENLKILEDEIIVKQRSGNNFNYLRFSENGQFLNEIGTDPESAALQNPKDILLYNDEYVVWDASGVHTFSKNGKYLGQKFETSHSGSSFFHTHKNFYLFHGAKAPGYLSKYSLEGEFSGAYKTNNQTVIDQNYSRVIELAKDSFHLFSPVIDTVLKFSDGQLSPGYLIEGESHPTLVNVLREIQDLDEIDKLKYLHSNKHWVIKRYLENRDYIFVVYRLASDSFYTIIRKSDWKTSYFEQVINDIDGGLWDYPMYLSENNELYIPLGTYQISGHKMLNKRRFDFEKVMERNQQNNSPVIMKCKLK